MQHLLRHSSGFVYADPAQVRIRASFIIDSAQKLVGVLMAQGPSNRVRTRMLFKNLVYGALVEPA